MSRGGVSNSIAIVGSERRAMSYVPSASNVLEGRQGERALNDNRHDDDDDYDQVIIVRSASLTITP